MYTRWAEQHGYKVEWIEETAGEGAGIKSATIRVKGHNAYGWLKTEHGVHRLVRISPFDSNARRHTSFASVYVYPVVDDSIEINVSESDVRIDTYRSSGSGGQHVNTTDSAVRITHLPTGIVVTSSLKSQHQNRAQAMVVLRARLYEAQRDARDTARADARREQVGSGDRSERIRTYNFPQGRVTDHRINLTLYKLDRVIAGDALDELISALITEHQAAQLAAMEGIN
jgi:peptide chain release factor 1